MRTRRSHRNQDRLWRAIGQDLKRRAELPKRLFCGTYPCGLVYADKGREEHGDYKRLAFLPFRTLVLEFEKDCPADFRRLIEAEAAPVIARRGEEFQVSTAGQTVRLGV